MPIWIDSLQWPSAKCFTTGKKKTNTISTCCYFKMKNWCAPGAYFVLWKPLNELLVTIYWWISLQHCASWIKINKQNKQTNSSQKQIYIFEVNHRWYSLLQPDIIMSTYWQYNYSLIQGISKTCLPCQVWKR